MRKGEIAALADRFLIRELIDDYSNICTQRAWDRLPDLFTDECVWRTRGSVHRDYFGRAQVVAAIISVVDGYRMVFQMPHAPSISLDGDAATATTLINEIVRVDDAQGRLVLAIYHDKVVRTAQGWKFAERMFRGTYIETVSMPGAHRPA